MFIQQVGKFLVLLALVWLATSIMLILLPWRRWLGWPFGLAQPPTTITEFDAQDVAPIPSPWKLGVSDWVTFGRMEAVLLLGATAISLHGVALSRAVNRDGATFALLVLALIWTLFTAARLQRALQFDSKREKARIIAGLELGDQVEYSDDDGHAKLLFDDKTGLRGRPDQIVRMQGQFIPVEVKTGKVPTKPHDSHRMQLLAYLHLVEQIVDDTPPFGILRYGEKTAFSISWNTVSRDELMTSVKEVQRLMVKGGAARNHEREGKCQNCSRRVGCSESLV
jgi:CRISPR-associated exonuclease Cas4